MNKKLIFVYNATKNPVEFVEEFVGKFLPHRKPLCNLCYITYPILLEKKEWRSFLDSLEIQSEFLLKDDFEKTYLKGEKRNAPGLYWKENTKLELVITPEEINSFNNASELIKAVKTVLKNKDDNY